jgi:serine/threonine protein phosphatase PrpC
MKPISFDMLLACSEQAGREYQQDRFVVLEDHHNHEFLIVVADGVGGSHDGGMAAQIVVDTAAMIWQQRQNYADGAALLQAMAHQANLNIRQFNQNSPDSASTFAAALWRNQQLFIAHAGDSRVYLIDHNQGVKQVVKQTQDHSLAYAKYLMGELSYADIATHPSQNQLLNCLDGREETIIDVQQWPYEELQYLVLCTDGAWEIFANEQLTTLCADANRRYQFANCVDEMLLQSPHHDNTTLILGQFVSEHAKTQNDETSDQFASVISPQIEQVVSLPPEGEALNIGVNSAVTQSSTNHFKFKWLFLLFGFLLTGWLLLQLAQVSLESNTAEKRVSEGHPQSKDNDQKPTIPTSKNSERNSDNATTGETSVEAQDSLRENLQDVPEIVLQVDGSTDILKALLQRFYELGLLGQNDKLQTEKHSKDEFAEIFTVQQYHLGVPVFGGVVKYRKTATSIELLSGQVSLLTRVPKLPTHQFTDCFVQYQKHQQKLSAPEVSLQNEPVLYIDPASQGYFWLVTIRQQQQQLQLFLADESCQPLRIINDHIA